MILSTLALCALLGITTAQTGSYATSSAPNPSEEICPQFQFDSESRLDCSRTTCLAPLNSTGNCLQYCEIRRAGFVGPVGIPQTPWNGTTDAWEAKDLPAGEGTPGAGELVDVLTGINQTSWMENVPGMQAIRESVGYECMYSPPPLFSPPPSHNLPEKWDDAQAEINTTKSRQHQLSKHVQSRLQGKILVCQRPRRSCAKNRGIKFAGYTFLSSSKPVAR